MVKNPPAVRETWVQSSGWEDPLGKGEKLFTPVFWPGEFHGLHSPRGRKESDTAERLSLSPSQITEIQKQLLKNNPFARCSKKSEAGRGWCAGSTACFWFSLVFMVSALSRNRAAVPPGVTSEFQTRRRRKGEVGRGWSVSGKQKLPQQLSAYMSWNSAGSQEPCNYEIVWGSKDF